MRLLIKQRVFSWSDTYDIYDENENIRYFVKAEVFALGHQLHVYDAWNNEVGRISQEVLHWGDTYVIDIANPEDELMGLILAIAIDAANCTN